MPKFIDITGQRFGRWTVIRRIHDMRPGVPRWLCHCDCGNIGDHRSWTLKSGGTQSCGCLAQEVWAIQRKTHGMSYTPTYRSWVGMWGRCRNPRNTFFPKYGGRGITVCDRWLSFENFLADMGERPAGLTIDRVDNTRGYEPGNCRWATRREQQNNRSVCRYITHDGRTLTAKQWAASIGISYETIISRLNRGMPIAMVLSTSKL